MNMKKLDFEVFFMISKLEFYCILIFVVEKNIKIIF